MTLQREFFPRVRRRVVPRPVIPPTVDVMGVAGTARAAAATIHGPNWHHDEYHDLVEIWDAGPALCFKHLLPDGRKYARENLFLQTAIAYRTTENANANLRTFSGNHVTLPNAVHGAIYEDPHAAEWVTEDLTLNVNSIYRDERIWIQRVDWEWLSRDVVYEDELPGTDPWLHRSEAEVAALYAEPELNEELIRDYLVERLRQDHAFLTRCVVALAAERLQQQEDPVAVFRRLRGHGESEVLRDPARALTALCA